MLPHLGFFSPITQTCEKPGLKPLSLQCYQCGIEQEKKKTYPSPFLPALPLVFPSPPSLLSVLCCQLTIFHFSVHCYLSLLVCCCCRAQRGRPSLFGQKVRSYSLSPAPGRPHLYRQTCLLEDDEDDSEVAWVDEDDEDEEEEEDDRAFGHTLRVAVEVPIERRNLVNPCELNPARLRQTRMSFFLSGLLLMALTMLWLAFI